MNMIRLSPTVKIFLWICGASFIIQQTADRFLGANLESFFGLVPSSLIFEHKIWQLFTYAFLHADPTHLILNLLMMAFIASDLEFLWGRVKFLFFYFTCSVMAGIVYIFLQALVWKGDGLQTPMVGASAAIYGLLVAYGWKFSERTLLFMMLFPMKAKHFVWVLAGMEFLMTTYSGRVGLSNAAHLSGMASGLLFLWIDGIYKQKNNRIDLFSKLKPNRRNHLKLISNQDLKDKKTDDKPRTWH